jgi:hypothetical protein
MKNNKKNNFSVPISPPAPSNNFEERSEKCYPNSDACKEKILSDNKNKSGIYKWENKINGKRYIGSSENLNRRFREYFNINYLLKNKSMYICNSLIKHGYFNFSLTILEYCSPDKCLEREAFY